jgi:hypothetical protein
MREWMNRSLERMRACRTENTARKLVSLATYPNKTNEKNEW